MDMTLLAVCLCTRPQKITPSSSSRPRADPSSMKGNCGASAVFIDVNFEFPTSCNCGITTVIHTSCTCGTRTTYGTTTITQSCNCGSTTVSSQRAHRPPGSELQLRNLHGLLHSLDHWDQPLSHDRDDDNLGNLHNRGIDHHVHKQLGNLDGPQNSLDHWKSLCATTGMLMTIGELQLRNQHSFLNHRTTHLSLHHNGHNNNLQEQHLERTHCGYLSLLHNGNVQTS